MFKRIALFFSAILLLLTTGLFLCACTQTNSNTQPPPKDSVKGSMDEAEQKLSTSLVQLVNEKFLPAGKTKDQAVSEMKEQGQIKDISSGGKNVAAVYVYIQLTENADMKVLDACVLNTENKDDKAKLAASWVDISRLKEIAALTEVRSIKEVDQPVTNQK